MSVRKLHLSGRNHIKLYCDYYEEKARQLGIWDEREDQYEVDVAYLNSKKPSPENFRREMLRQKENKIRRDDDDEPATILLPPPPTISSMPPPPPSVLRYAEEDKEAIAFHMARQEKRAQGW